MPERIENRFHAIISSIKTLEAVGLRVLGRE